MGIRGQVWAGPHRHTEETPEELLLTASSPTTTPSRAVKLGDAPCY